MSRLRIPALVASFTFLAFAGAAFAWTGPTQSPPSGNIAAPVNVGSTFQDKAGGFWADGGVGINNGSAFCIGNSCITAWPSGGSGFTGSGTANYLAKFTDATALGNSSIFDNGSVGIGTASPNSSFRLDVLGLMRAYSSTNDAGVYLGSISSGRGEIQGINAANNAAKDLELQGSGGNVLIDNGTSKVGIGTANPLSYAVLDVNTSAGKAVHTMDSAYGGLLIGYQGPSVQGRTTADGNGNLYLNNYGGNVGIGTASPTAKLHIIGTGATAVDLAVNGRVQTGDSTNNGGVWLNSANTAFIGTEGNSTLGLFTAGAGWALSVLQNGNVGINTSNPSTALEVNGNATIDGTLIIGLQYIKCRKNFPCDTGGPGNPDTLVASCPAGTQLISCAPVCYDPVGIRDCAADLSATYCNVACQNVNGGGCSGNYQAEMVCARIQ